MGELAGESAFNPKLNFFPPSALRRAFTLFSCLILLTCVFSISSLAYSSNMTYDSNGNLLSDGTYIFEYNEANMLARVRDASNTILEEYWYDADGNRLIKIEYFTGGNSTTYYFSPSYEETHYSNGTVVKTTFVFANNERAAGIRNGVKTYYLDDHLGSSSVLVNESGGVVDRVSYMPYGLIKTRTGEATDYLFNSKELDTGTGLLYYGARYYNPWLQRWTQPDTIIQNPYDPQMLNRYSYTINNPLKYTDTTGHVVVPLLILLAAGGVGGLVAYSQTPGEHTILGAATYAGAGMAGATATYIIAPAVAVEAGVQQFVTQSIGRQVVASAVGGGVEKSIQNVYGGKAVTEGMAESMAITGGAGALGAVGNDFSSVIKGGMFTPTKVTSTLTTKTGLYLTKGALMEESLQFGIDYSLDKKNWVMQEEEREKEYSVTCQTTTVTSQITRSSSYYYQNYQTQSNSGSTYRSLMSSKYPWMAVS